MQSTLSPVSGEFHPDSWHLENPRKPRWNSKQEWARRTEAFKQYVTKVTASLCVSLCKEGAKVKRCQLLLVPNYCVSFLNCASICKHSQLDTDKHNPHSLPMWWWVLFEVKITSIHHLRIHSKTTQHLGVSALMSPECRRKESLPIARLCKRETKSLSCCQLHGAYKAQMTTYNHLWPAISCQVFTQRNETVQPQEVIYS